MKRKVWMFTFMVAIVFALSACGAKSKEDVVKSLDKRVGEMKSYKANAEMTVKVGNEPQKYDIEVWHKAPDFYRVHLKKGDKDQSQMILRNEGGVYVLTPALNKSFRFQSDWPDNNSQPYLYASLIEDILKDEKATLKEEKKSYLFGVKTRYQNNKMFPTQEISIHKKNLAPKKVSVLDADKKEVISVVFSAFEFDPTFDKGAFEMKKNMTSAQLEVPVSAPASDKKFSIQYPSEELLGIKLIEKEEMETEVGHRVVLTYGGDKSFTLIQERALVLPTMVRETEVSDGEIADLGFAIGVVTDNSMTWTNNGVTYMIATKDLTREEMVMVAKSVQETNAKAK